MQATAENNCGKFRNKTLGHFWQIADFVMVPFYWSIVYIGPTSSSNLMSRSPPLDNVRVMVVVWRIRGNIIRTALCWIVWHNVHGQQHTYMSSSCRSNRLGLSHWDPCAVCRGGCLWWSGSGEIQAWSRRPTGFSQSLDTVGLVIWPVKVVPKTTYNVLSGTLSLYTTITTLIWCAVMQSRVHYLTLYDKQYLNMQIVGKLKLKLRLFDLLTNRIGGDWALWTLAVYRLHS